MKWMFCFLVFLFSLPAVGDAETITILHSQRVTGHLLPCPS